MFDHWITQDLLVVAGFTFLAWIIWRGSHNERWERAWSRFRSDRAGIISMGIVIFYLLLGALEVVNVPVGGGVTRSLLDLLLPEFRFPVERSYSEPLATTHLDTNLGPLKGRHILGTNALGKDVLVQ